MLYELCAEEQHGEVLPREASVSDAPVHAGLQGRPLEAVPEVVSLSGRGARGSSAQFDRVADELPVGEFTASAAAGKLTVGFFKRVLLNFPHD